MRMLTRRIALIAAVSVATLSAGGHPPSSTPWSICEEIGCGYGDILCATFSMVIGTFPGVGDVEVTVICYQSLR